jgi:hypothetical protein
MNYRNTAKNDTRFIAELIDNNEWERAYRRAELLLGALTQVMNDEGITLTPYYIHNTTPVA